MDVPSSGAAKRVYLAPGGKANSLRDGWLWQQPGQPVSCKKGPGCDDPDADYRARGLKRLPGVFAKATGDFRKANPKGNSIVIQDSQNKKDLHQRS